MTIELAGNSVFISKLKNELEKCDKNIRFDIEPIDNGVIIPTKGWHA